MNHDSREVAVRLWLFAQFIGHFMIFMGFCGSCEQLNAKKMEMHGFLRKVLDTWWAFDIYIIFYINVLGGLSLSLYCVNIYIYVYIHVCVDHVFIQTCACDR